MLEKANASGTCNSIEARTRFSEQLVCFKKQDRLISKLVEQSSLVMAGIRLDGDCEGLVNPQDSSLGTGERLVEEAQLHIGASDSVGSIVGLADGHANEDCREGEVKTTLNDSLGSEESECAENVAVQVGIRNEASISTEPGDDRVGVAVNGMESALKVHPEMFHAGSLESLNAAQDADEVTVGTTQVDSPSHVERAALSVGGDVIKPQQCECADGGLIAQSSPSLQGMESVAPGDEVVDRTSLQCGSPSGVTGGTLLHENHSEPSIHDVVEEPKESSRRQRRKMSKKRARARIEKVANEVPSELRPRKTKNMPPMVAASIEPGEDRGVRQFQGSFEEAIALLAAGFDQKAEESDSDDSVASSAGGSSPDWCCNVVTPTHVHLVSVVSIQTEVRHLLTTLLTRDLIWTMSALSRMMKVH